MGIVAKCLAKQTEDRYQAAEDLVADLGLLQQGSDKDISATKLMTGRMQRGIWSRLMGVTALVVLAAVAVIGWQILKGDNQDIPDREQALAVVGFRNLQNGEDDTGSAALSSLVNVGLVESSPVRVVSASYLQDLRRSRRIRPSRWPRPAVPHFFFRGGSHLSGTSRS
jgi:hypothetical protein